ncbi:MAG TPA: hemolysin family protein [Caldisericia bacterium]|nr:hemolysin family protein [Caldisericia bacterium]
MESSFIYYFWIVILILLSAFFSASEAALLSVSRIKLMNLVNEKSKIAEKVLHLKSDASKFISAILVGNNIVNILATSLFTRLLIEKIGPTEGVILSTIITSIVIIIFGEMLPKSIGAAGSLKISMLVYYPVTFFIYIFYPIVYLLTKLSQFTLRLLGIKNSFGDLITTQEELETVINASHEEGLIEEEQKELMKSVFEFRDIRVYEVMVPRVDMVTINVEGGISKFMEVVGETGYSRIPVYEDSIDNIIGILYSKDVMSKIGKGEDIEKIEIRKIMRKAEFVPDSKKVEELFREMREKKLHMVIVIDEYGGVAGLITLEDIIEELVGEIQDEYDTEEPFFKLNEDGSYEIAGSYPIDDLNELLQIDLSSEEYDTISGFILSSLGHIPTVNEKLTYGDYVFRIEQIKNRRIIKVRVEKNKESIGEEYSEKNNNS